MKRKTLQNQLPKQYRHKNQKHREMLFLSLEKTLKGFSWMHWNDQYACIRLLTCKIKEKGLKNELKQWRKA